MLGQGRTAQGYIVIWFEIINLVSFKKNKTFWKVRSPIILFHLISL